MSNSQELPAGVPELTREELNGLILLCDEPDSENDLLTAYALGAQRAAEARLDAIPEGCTPADAAVLREANHGLAAELRRLQAEVEGLRADAERWGAIRRHWKTVQFRFHKRPAGLLKSLTMTVDFTSRSADAVYIEREIDAAIAASKEQG